MGVHIGVADGDVQKLYAKLFMEDADELFAFRQVGNKSAFLCHAESVGRGEAVIDIHP